MLLAPDSLHLLRQAEYNCIIMRKAFLIASFFFTATSIVFSAMPFDTLAFIPIALAVICIFIVLKKSTADERKTPKRLFIVLYICSAIVLLKTFLIKNEVAKDADFEKEKIETKKEAKKELENLEKDLE